MLHGIFIHKHPILYNKTALLILQDDGTIKAQFDDLNLAKIYTHSWKTFSVRSFDIYIYNSTKEG